MPITVAEAFVTLRPDLKGFGDEVGKSLNSMGPKFQQAGTMMTAGLTLPIVGLGAVATKASISFESAFAGVRKTVDATDAQFDVMRKSIREMAKEMPASASEIAKVAQTAGALGVKNEDILRFTETMIKLGTATDDLDADQAAVAMAHLRSIMNLSQVDIERAASALVHLGNNGASTEGQIVEMASRIAGAGKQVGLSVDEVLAFANALSSIGIEVEAGGSSISRVFAELDKASAKGGEDLEGFAEIAGMSADAFAKAFKDDAASATLSFIEGLGKIEAEGGTAFLVLDKLGLADIRLSRALLGAAGAGDLFRQSLADGKKGYEENRALNDEFQVRMETTAAKIDKLINKLNDIAITLGDALVPVFLEAVDAAGPVLKIIEAMAEGFAKLPGPVKTGIVAILALVAVVGPLLFMIGGMATGFAALIAILSFVGIAFVGGTVAVTGFAAGFAALTLAALPWIALAAAIGIAGYLIYKNWDKITAVLSSVASTVKDVLLGALSSVLDFIKGHWQTIALLISGPFFPLVALATDAFGIRSALLNAFASIAAGAGRSFSTVRKVITDNWREIAGILSGPIGILAFNSFGIRDGLIDAFTKALPAVREGVDSINRSISENFTAENIGSAFAWFLLWPVFLFKRAFDAVVPVLSTFFFSTLPAFFTQTIPALGASALALGSSIAKGIASGLAQDAVEIANFTRRLPGLVASGGAASGAAGLSLGTSIVKGIVSGLGSALAAVTTFLTSTLPGAIAGAAGAVGAAALKLGGSIIDGIVSGINGAMHLLQAAPGAIKDAFVNAASDAGRWLYEAGQEVVEGFWEGIKDQGTWLFRQAKGFFAGFLETVKGTLGEKHSPSEITKVYGEDLMKGLAHGIEKGGAEAEAATKQVMQKLRAVWEDWPRDNASRLADAHRIAGEAGMPELGAAFERAQKAATKWREAHANDQTSIGSAQAVNNWRRQMEVLWDGVEKVGTQGAKDASQGMTTGLADGINKGLDKDVKPAMANVRKTLAEVMATVDKTKTLPAGSIDPIIQALPTLEAKLKAFQTQGTEPRFLEATKAYLELLKQSFASTTSVVEQMGPKLQASFANLGPQLQQSGVSAMQGFGAGLTSGVTAAVAPVAQTLDSALIGAAAQGADTASVGGAQVGAGLAAGVQGGLQTLGPEFAAHLDAAVSAGASSAVPAATSAGVSIGDGVGIGMKSSDGPRASSAAMVELISNALSVGGWGEIGRSVVEGVWEGMSSASGWLANMASNLFGSLKRSIEDKLKAHSPAETMVPVGESIMQGVAKGMEQSYERDIKPLMSTITSGISSTDIHLSGGSGLKPLQTSTEQTSKSLDQFGDTTGDASKTVTKTSSMLDTLTSSAQATGLSVQKLGAMINAAYKPPNRQAIVDDGASDERYYTAAGAVFKYASGAGGGGSGGVNPAYKPPNIQAIVDDGWSDERYYTASGAGVFKYLSRPSVPVPNYVPRLLGGMDWVPSDRFPAYLDRGERVLTAQENQVYSRGGAASDGIALNFLAPVTVNNKGPDDDVRKIMGDIGYAMQQDARLRGNRR